MAMIALTKGVREIEAGRDIHVSVISMGFDMKKGIIRATVRDGEGATLSDYFRIGTPKHPNPRALDDFSSFVRACLGDWKSERLGIDTDNLDSLVGSEIKLDVTATEGDGRVWKHFRNYREVGPGEAGAEPEPAPAPEAADEGDEGDVWG